MEKNNDDGAVNIQDDFLSEENFNALRDLISTEFFIDILSFRFSKLCKCVLNSP